MSEILSKFDAGAMIGLVAVAGVFLCGIIAIIAGVWRENRRAEIDAALKQEMLNRGLSAEDIRTVMDAGTKCSRKAHRDRQISQS